MNDIKKYASTLFINAQGHLKQCVDNAGDEEALHKLRVELKKIQALQHLLLYCYSDCFKQHSKLDKLFHHAGNIRNLQLLSSGLKKQIKGKEGKEVLKDIHKQLDRGIKRFIERYKGHEAETFERSKWLVAGCVTAKPEKGSSLYFVWLREKITDSIEHLGHRESEIHQLRKHLKILKYNLHLCANVDIKNQIDEKTLNKQEKLLGDWHDAVKLASRFKKLSDKKNAKGELKKELNRLRKLNIDHSRSRLKKFRGQGKVNTISEKK